MAKPRCKQVTLDDNIYYIMGSAYDTLEKAGKKDQAETMLRQIEKSESLGEALRIIGMYVRIEE